MMVNKEVMNRKNNQFGRVMKVNKEVMNRNNN